MNASAAGETGTGKVVRNELRERENIQEKKCGLHPRIHELLLEHFKQDSDVI